MRPLAAFLLIGLGFVGGGERHRGQASVFPLAFIHVTVVDVERGILLPNRTVIVEGNRILAVGASTATPVPSGARVVDATGKYLIPGLWDMHVHVMAEPDVPLDLFPAFGVTSIRDVGGSLTPLRVLQRQLRSAERVGPRLLICGPVLDGYPPTHP